MNLKDLIPHRKSISTDTNHLINFQQEMNNLFESMFSNIDVFPTFSSLNWVPYLNIIEQEKDIVIKVELPGMDEKDITIETNKNQFIIQGEKKSESEEKDNAYHVRELSYGKFARVVSLPFNIDSDKAKASFSKGILTISVEKPMEQISQKKTIPITPEDA